MADTKGTPEQRARIKHILGFVPETQTTTRAQTQTLPDYILQSKDGTRRAVWISADDEEIIIENPDSTKTNLTVSYPGALQITTHPDGSKEAKYLSIGEALSQYKKAPGQIIPME